MCQPTTETLTVEDLRAYERVAERIDPDYRAWVKHARPDLLDSVLYYLNGGAQAIGRKDAEHVVRNWIKLFTGCVGEERPVRVPNDDDLNPKPFMTREGLQVGSEMEPVFVWSELDRAFEFGTDGSLQRGLRTLAQLPEARHEVSVLARELQEELFRADTFGLYPSESEGFVSYYVGDRRVTRADFLAEVRDLCKKAQDRRDRESGKGASRPNPNHDAF